MINPSINGWIDKFLSEQKPISFPTNDANLFYENIRETGFLFGHIIAVNTHNDLEIKSLLKNELSKIALLNTLYNVYCLSEKEANPEKFITKSVSFYNEMNPQGFNLFKKILPKNTPSQNLEDIINERVKTNDSVINKSFSHLITNALLFVDVLAFNQYLIHNAIPEKYLKKLEETIMSIVALALKTKTNKSQHDDLLIKLFEASVRYSKFSKVSVQNLESLNLDYFDNDLEKKYLIDLAGLTLWSDGILENNEAYFLYKLAEIMQVSDKFVTESIIKTNDFILQNKKQISFLNISNPVKNFYDQTTQNVVTLILRNKKRLAKEISESKELMKLLALSTQRDLDEKEKKKVKNQLLDICKTVPSLTIFLIPGGSLLLPILIKFIPQLLPSSFNENLDENQ
jgi:hypothetical protein